MILQKSKIYFSQVIQNVKLLPKNKLDLSYEIVKKGYLKLIDWIKPWEFIRILSENKAVREYIKIKTKPPPRICLLDDNFPQSRRAPDPDTMIPGFENNIPGYAPLFPPTFTPPQNSNIIGGPYDLYPFSRMPVNPKMRIINKIRRG